MLQKTDKHILVIEDQKDISELITMQLELLGHNIDISPNIKNANEKLLKNHYDLLLIDRMLPDGLGINLCQDLRKKTEFKSTPIIFVTALSEPEHIIEGLDAGADDYITKPFDLKILQARVQANLRRNLSKQSIQNEFRHDKILLNTSKCEVKIDDIPINLTHSEYQILCLLIKNPGVVHSRKELISKILGDDIHVTNRVIDTHIVGLRKKIKEQAKYIETIRGVGYRFTQE